MPIKQKIGLFFTLLILNHIFHTYEIYITGYQKKIPQLFSSPIVFLMVQSLLLIFLLFIGFQLIRKKYGWYPIIKVVAVLYLIYGLLLAFGNIYKEETVIGSFTGFFHVMICLPLVLWISDYQKNQERQ